jgi:hypothetical protein
MQDEIINVVPEVDENNPEQIENPKSTLIGVVIGCRKLNIRKGPSVNADVVCEVPESSELLIDISKSTTEWFSVCTTAGVDGFCMRKYVATE